MNCEKCGKYGAIKRVIKRVTINTTNISSSFKIKKAMCNKCWGEHEKVSSLNK